ncbi:MAG: ABC transporter substrate-binding protein, partial [Clostridia bacterium]|nr:ABC transporter substrate-binding protein [Clostridia bacterium]
MKIKRFLTAFLALILLLPTAGCKKDNGDARLYFELPNVPITVDPQTAATDAELVLVRNLYEGLLRTNGDGKIVAGVAESYSVDGLTYTFHLRKNAHWDSGEPLTADDFVFGLQRAVDPATVCPTAERLSVIEGAAAILSGKADASALKVTATDDHTLTVTLCRESADFPAVLTTAACMPCNRSYFEKTGGKYGLDRQNVLCNGSYYLARWNQVEFGVRLRKNAEYYGDFTAKNAEVFLSCSNGENSMQALTNGKIDLAMLYGSQAESAAKQGFRTEKVENICWVMTVSDEYSAEMRKAFAQSIDRSVPSATAGFRAADSLYPAVLSQQNVAGVGLLPYDLADAQARFAKALQNSEDKFPKTVLYYDGSANPDIKDVMTKTVAYWQQHLNAFINIEAA